MGKTIMVSEKTHIQLKELKVHRNSPFEEVICMLIKNYKGELNPSKEGDASI